MNRLSVYTRTPLVYIAILCTAGCAEPRTVIQTKVIEKPVAVHCEVELPRECLDRYAIQRLRQGADPVEVARAVMAEVEERSACEVKLRAAVKGCNERR